MRKGYSLLVTCEHGGSRIPDRFTPFVRWKRSDLTSHHSYDPGALHCARAISRRLGARLFSSTVSRFLIDMNRSPGHPKLFPDRAKALGAAERRFILKRYYLPYRRSIEAYIAACVRRRKKVLHLAVHTFTPVWKGRPRDTDIGLLYDPSRRAEKRLCMKWQGLVRQGEAGLRVRRNFPYRGRADGLTTYLRKRFPGWQYLGIELEISQDISLSADRKRASVLECIIRGLDQSLST